MNEREHMEGMGMSEITLDEAWREAEAALAAYRHDTSDGAPRCKCGRESRAASHLDPKNVEGGHAYEPDAWVIRGLTHGSPDDEAEWVAGAGTVPFWESQTKVRGHGPTPAAALLALAVKLREDHP